MRGDERRPRSGRSDLLQARVQVPLGRGEGSVPEELLYGSEIASGPVRGGDYCSGDGCDSEQEAGRRSDCLTFPLILPPVALLARATGGAFVVSWAAS